MIVILLALAISLALNVLSGSLVFLLWNYGPAMFEVVPEMSWLTGVASYLLVRLILSPPKIEFNLNPGSLIHFQRQIIMQGLKKTIAVFLGLVGAWIFINGLALAVQTMGRVTGTEFSMLITVNHQLGLIAMWLGLYGLWAVVPGSASDE